MSNTAEPIATTLTLAEFLLARLAEDAERAARAVGRGTMWGRVADGVAAHDHASGLHVLDWSPARVLDECEGKLAIVAEVAGWHHHVQAEDCWFTCPAATDERDGGETCDDGRRGGSCDCGLERRQRAILAPLALPYADRHPDYREEWRP